MNNDLISRSALKEAIEEYRSLNCVSTSTIIGVRNVFYLIDNAPTVLHDNYSMGYQDGVREVLSERQGKWIEEENDEMEIVGYHCSKCDLPNEEKTDYCPNCGCKMVNEDGN